MVDSKENCKFDRGVKGLCYCDYYQSKFGACFLNLLSLIKTENFLTTYTYDIQNGQLPFLPIADPAILHPVEDSAISLKI